MSGTKKQGRVKAALLDWLGVPIQLTNGEFLADWKGVSQAGTTASVGNSLELSAAWACIRLLAETISTLPLKLYQKNPDGSRSLANAHPIGPLINKQPNIEMTPSRFMQMIVASVYLQGNAFIEKRRVGTRVVALNPLLPQRMAVDRRDDGSLRYRYNDPLAGKLREIPEKDVVHVRGFGLDGMVGLDPISTGKQIFGGAAATEQAANKMFAQGMQASGILSAETPLKAEQRERLQKHLERFSGSANAGKVMVTEGGMKYQSITMNPEAAQMLESRAFGVEEICRWFRVPPFMVGHMDKQSSWASSTEAMNLQFLTNTLRPMLTNIEQELNRCLLANDERYYVEFSVEGLLRADSAGRASYYSTLLQNGVMSRNEVRRLENLSNVEGGDTLTVQSAMMALKDVGANNGSDT